MLNWIQQFSILLFLDNNGYNAPVGNYECLAGIGGQEVVRPSDGDALIHLQEWHDTRQDWLFGHICYDYKNKLESKLSSNHTANTHFPDISFFQPEIVVYINRDRTKLCIESLKLTPDEVYDQILQSSEIKETALPQINFQQRILQQEYLGIIDTLRKHIEDGDCYEINFCNEGFCENVTIDPVTVFHKLNTISPAPFAAYYRLEDKHLMSASPERYLMKQGSKVLSQPIKGTAKRGTSAAEDEQRKTELQTSIKERAENVMIVDLVRNDLARCCEVGSIAVDELFKIYTFPQVHQMISTVSGQLQTGKPFTDAIRYSFPMGSMTGAPKIMVMQLIEKYEKARRELFSGTVGYITPDGDFDFNVVIRSLFYNAGTQYLSYQTGGAITYDSDPQQEYDEMRLKAWALERSFMLKA
ncbi:aminodeoxychorismate synthase component I [Taibaiella soli]|uniref:Aminodeoxychorismate synthase component I n=2 Tax=Taibaiella soli TaxID=1649169 RepID=A0A2W2B4H2_9BACT|nr:aminodeoxychorismate synthase component I [Taibaiella soli]